MRIAYLYFGASLSAVRGVTRKVRDQTSEWRRSGHGVDLYLQAGGDAEVQDHETDWAGMSVRVFGGDHGRDLIFRSISRFGAARRLVDAVIDDRPDIAYLRFSVYYPSLSTLAAEVPLCLEVNTDDVAEYRRQLNRLQYVYHRLTRSRLLRAAHGTVFVTNELQRHRRFQGYGYRSVVIPNGIQVERVPPSRVPDHQQIRLVFVGEPGLPWHGVDKIVRLARMFPSWHFDVVGYSAHQAQASPPGNLAFHGYLSEDEYARVLAGATVGLGTLALHRKSMDEACPLKVRGYLAAGLPVITGNIDPDLNDDMWYVLRLPNEEANVERNSERIRAFVERVHMRRVTTQDIGHLHVRAKEEQRLRFFEALTGDSSR